MSKESTLVVDNLVVDYSRRGGTKLRAVAGVSLTVAEGEVVGLVGESGCGKSTVARAIVGLVAPTSGSIVFGGRPVADLGHARRPAELTRLQMIFQDSSSSLNPRRRIGAQLLDGVRASGNRAELGRVDVLLGQVGLPAAAARRFPHEFSGGQRQRIAIARALATDPSIIIADEAVAALDASSQAQIATLLVSVCREFKVGLLFISHDLTLVRSIADNVMVMYLGRIMETAPAEVFWSRPAHPYTQALLNAIPLPDGRRVLPAVLPGEVPDPADPPEGCRFHPRCPIAVARCATDEPPLRKLAQGHRSACWFSTPRGPDTHTAPLSATNQQRPRSAD